MIYHGAMKTLQDSTALSMAFSGKRGFNPELFAPVSNTPLFDKPTGGLWLSPLTDDGSRWSQQCEIMDRACPSIEAIPIAPEARILLIENLPDYEALCAEYFYELAGDDALTIAFGKKWLDFERVAREWDGLYVSQEAIWNARWRVPDDKTGSLALWDVETLLIFNLTAIRPASKASA